MSLKNFDNLRNEVIATDMSAYCYRRIDTAIKAVEQELADLRDFVLEVYLEASSSRFTDRADWSGRAAKLLGIEIVTDAEKLDLAFDWKEDGDE